MEKFSVIGKSSPQLDAEKKVTGQARFVTDMRPAGTVFAKILRSPYPHARIVNINTARAERLIGVKAVITGENVPQHKFGPMIDDWEFLAKDRVRFVGDEVAAVAAIDEDLADEALDLIEVEYEELPAVFDPEEAIKEGAPLLHEGKKRNIAAIFEVEKGDMEAGFKQADYIFEDVYHTSQTYQAYLETKACIAVPDGGEGLILYLPTQIPSISQMRYAQFLGMPESKIRVVQPLVGGAFGGKFEYKSHIIAAQLARITRFPVKIVNTREEDFIAGNPRVPMKIYLKLGVKKDGTITAKEVKIYGANGARTVYAPAIVSTACYRNDSLYTYQNVRNLGYTVYTNTVPTGCFRGFGNSQAHFAMESALDMIAREIDMDPAELRLRNGVYKGYTSVHGWEILSCGLKECIEKATAKVDWLKKRSQPRDNNSKIKKGIGLAICNHVNGNRSFFPPFDGSTALVRISPYGKVTVFSGEADIGQGMNTVFAQIAAEALGVSLQRVRTAVVDTKISPFGLGTFSTRGTTVGGRAVYEAGVRAKNEFLKQASQVLGFSVGDLDIKNDMLINKTDPQKNMPFNEIAFIISSKTGGSPVMGQGTYIPDTVLPNENKYGNVSPAYSFGCQIAEIEVDTETGHVSIVNFVAAHDVGRVLNPLTLEGQVEGGTLMGIGWALTEEMIIKDGNVLNPNFLDYRVPTAMDIPENFENIFVESIDPNGPYGAKGVGEPAIDPTMAAVANAIFDATGVRINSIPILPEDIIMSLKKNNV